MFNPRDTIELELRDALHAQLDRVLDTQNPDRPNGWRVIDNILEEAHRGRVVSISVHTLPPPTATAQEAVSIDAGATISAPGDSDVPAGP